MTTWQAMHRLETLGYTFHLDEHDQIKARIHGEKPLEAVNLFETVRNDRESAKQYVKERQNGAKVVSPSIPDYRAMYRIVYNLHEECRAMGNDAEAWGQIVDRMHQTMEAHQYNPFLASMLGVVFDELERKKGHGHYRQL